MTQKANFFKLGLFVILAFGLTAAFLIAFGAGKFFKTEMLAETCFNESVQGLDIGSEVKYKGVKIGTVKSITTPTKFYNIPSNYVLVIFSLAEDCYVGQTGEDAEERIKNAVAEGLTISLAFKGLTGAAYLETDYRGKQKFPLDITWHPENTYVPSRRSNIKRIGDTINKLMDNLSGSNLGDLGKDLKTLVQKLNQKTDALNMESISTQAESLLKELRQTNEQVSGFLKSDRFTRLVADAGESAAELKTVIQDAKTPVANTLNHIEIASANASRITARFETEYGPRLDSLMASLDKTSKMLENMVWINSDTISSTIENFEDTSENLKQLTLELQKYPGRLLLESPPEVNTPERIKEKLKKDDF